MSVERIIGIDFGTSTSVIRVKRYNNGQPVDDRLSEKALLFGTSPIVPTVIQRTDKGTYYGYDALISKKSETLFQNFKVDLENPDPVQRQEARTLTEEFFAYIAKEYKAQSEGGHFGDSDDTEHTIISYPVKWSDETKAFLTKAAEKAGFKNVEGIDEAQAAIHAVTVQSEEYLTKHSFFMAGVPCNILLIDMGAGTTDLVLCRHTPGDPPKNEMLCTWPKAGDALFGGREADEILREYIRSLIPEDQADIVLKKNGIKEFKTWKETIVSPALARHEMVKEFSSIDNIVDLLDIDMEPYDLDRSRFEKLAEKYLEEFPRLIEGCIDSSGISKEEIDLVILTGGHSQWYFVEEMLTDRTKIDLPKIRENPDRVIPITRPQETVALGMVYRLLSVEFQKEPELGEEVKTDYKENELKETDINRPMIEAGRDSIAEYYRKNMSSLIAVLENDYSPYIGVMIVKPDGTIACEGKIIDPDVVAGWRDIVSISCGLDHTVGLRKNGTVVAAGKNKYGQCNVQSWRDIVSISCAYDYTIGLRKDGTVVSTGRNKYGPCNVQGWRDIASISFGGFSTIALKKDGTVVSTGYNRHGQCNVQGWRNIVSTSCGSWHTIGLRKDGTVVSTGYNRHGQCNVQGWRDIVSISCGAEHTIGLREDGTVVAVGRNKETQCNIQGWEDIVSISCGDWYTVGLKKDGTVVATGLNYAGQCNVEYWSNIIAVYGKARRTFGVRSDGTIIYSDYKHPHFFLDNLMGVAISIVPNGTKALPWKLF